MVARVAGLVSTSWLGAQVARQARNIRILDTRWTFKSNGYEDYCNGHIPEATFIDLNQCVKPTQHLPTNLPEQKCFAEYIQSLGINKGDHLIVYDKGTMLPASRVWWMFRAFGHTDISVLDGGLHRWDYDNHPTKTAPPLKPPQKHAETGDFEVRVNSNIIRKFDRLVEDVRAGSTHVVDGRNPEHFYGQETEPSKFTEMALSSKCLPLPPKPMNVGCIRGASHMWPDMLVDPDTKCLVSKDRLKAAFTAAGVDLNNPLVTMCYNGNAACLLALMAYECGHPDAAVYYGSWTEWGQRASSNDCELQTPPAAANKAGG